MNGLERNERDMMMALKDGITQSMIDMLANGEAEPEDEMIKSFLATIIDNPKASEFLKAIGIAHFGENKETCLVINDFCAYLHDLAIEGREYLES